MLCPGLTLFAEIFKKDFVCGIETLALSLLPRKPKLPKCIWRALCILCRPSPSCLMGGRGGGSGGDLVT